MPELAAKLGLDPEREHTLVFSRRQAWPMKRSVLYSTDILPLALFGGNDSGYDFSHLILQSWSSTAMWRSPRR